MIFWKIIESFLNFVYSLLFSLPTAQIELLESYPTLFNNLSALINATNLFFPASVAFYILFTIVSIEIAVNTMRGLVFLYKLLPMT